MKQLNSQELAVLVRTVLGRYSEEQIMTAQSMLGKPVEELIKALQVTDAKIGRDIALEIIAVCESHGIDFSSISDLILGLKEGHSG